ncbi:DUF397 domain-containing protein [Nocardiopsis alba]|uniref:DUF397 domain-containing protein n=1 Tax=Nocardiopsis alba TaxID=53437 RepID=A0A7K2IY06_9ACTN|nr:DUF397 domain-containing protein [Nocardiopsis alba]MYR34842.1 DUF397 domain-containing protein [Nocardiopsis alba]
MMEWHKSSYSNAAENCVEVTEGAETLVRDTQNRELGHLGFEAKEWSALLSTLQQ